MPSKIQQANLFLLPSDAMEGERDGRPHYWRERKGILEKKKKLYEEKERREIIAPKDKEVMTPLKRRRTRRFMGGLKSPKTKSTERSRQEKRKKERPGESLISTGAAPTERCSQGYTR